MRERVLWFESPEGKVYRRVNTTSNRMVGAVYSKKDEDGTNIKLQKKK